MNVKTKFRFLFITIIFWKESVKEPPYNRFFRGKLKSVSIPFIKMNGYPKQLGIIFDRNGKKNFVGIVQRHALPYKGRLYYPSGKIKFVGIYNEREKGGYYGPSYPIQGKFYSEEGNLVYEGKTKVVGQGGVGYPKVVIPEDFGSL